MVRHLSILLLFVAVMVGLLIPHSAPAGATPPTALSMIPNASNDDYTIKLRSREFIPVPGLSGQERKRLQTTAQSPAAQQSNRIHVLLQLETIPSPDEKAALAAKGINLLSYIPERTWVASIPSVNLDSTLATSGVRWLGALRVNDKLAPEIRSQQFAPWHYDARRDMVAVFLELHADIDTLDIARDLVLDNGGRIRGYVPSVNGVMAEVPRAALHTLATDDRVLWIETALPSLTPTNDGARPALNVDVLHPAPYNPTPTYNLDGSGVDVLVYDGGQVDNTHPDFAGRITIGASDTSSVIDHATHVAGTVGSDGSQSASDGGTANQWRGMAPSAGLISYGYEYDGTGTFFYTNLGDINNDWDEAKNTHGADIGTASLSTNLYVNSLFDPVNFQCAFEGDYGAASQLLDNIVRGSLGEAYIATWSNGNERGTATCGTQYNTTPPPACAKNPIHVGATNSNDNSMTGFSSWGPCDDGRLKPVVVAPGCQSSGDFAIHSTVANIYTNSSTRDCDGSGDDYCYPYDNMCGTSMSTPATAGIIALLLQQYRDTYNTLGEFLPSTAKAILMNTAADLGNTGPDFQFGYGHVDAQAAADSIIDGLFREGTIGATGEVDWYAIDVPAGATQLQVSLAWDDPGAAPLSTPALINDLDLALLDPDGGLHQPWVLDAANPANAATTGTDTVNNQEQVTINSPDAGIWRVRVTGTTAPSVPQTYSLAATDNMISLDIDKPTNAAPTSVGYFGDPDKLLISLDLRDRQGGPLGITIDSTTDLAFSIGGDSPATVFPGGNVGNFYWVLVTPPTKTTGGCHNLDVTLFGVLTDTETNAVCYSSTPTPSEDVMLVIDSSGSMSLDDKMPSTKDAARFFVTATNLNDMIGMDTFSSTAALMYPLTTVVGSSTKDDVNDEIDDLVADGWTAMGAGMDIANTELSTSGDASHDHTIVLLSDGRQNEPPMWAGVMGSIPASVVIHTVALGPDGDPDEPLLTSIASSFNGNYYRVPTGGSSLSANEAPRTAGLVSELDNVLADVYRSAAEETYGWERLWEYGGEVGEYCTGENISDTHKISVETNLSEAIFAAHWSNLSALGNNGPMELKRPDGTTVDPSDPDVLEHRLVGSRLGPGHEQYRIEDPEGGEWTLIMNGGFSKCSEYIAMLEARSPTQLLLLSPQPGQHIGFCQPVPLLTSFTGPSQPVVNAEVKAEIVGPLADTLLTLFDDGNHGDGQANDGWYGNTFDPCPQGPPDDDSGVGSYQIRVFGVGVNENSDPVERSKSSAYYASESTTGDPDPPAAQVLLVDDDEDNPDVRSAYTDALDSTGVAYDVWNVLNDGPPSSGNLTPYHTVIWFTGDDTASTLDASDEAALTTFLDEGGKLFLSSQHYLFDVGSVNSFMETYLHIDAVQNDVGASSVEGVNGNAISDGLGPYTLSSLAEFADKLTPATGAQSTFVNQTGSTLAVNFTDGSSCTLFAVFPFELLAAADAEEAMQHILDWECWDPDIQVTPPDVEGDVLTGIERMKPVEISNAGRGKLAWTVNSGPIHLWAMTDADGEVPTFLQNLDPALAAIGSTAGGASLSASSTMSEEIDLDVCTVTTGVADCCTGAACSQAELLDQDVLIIYNNQAFADPTGLGNTLADFVDQGGAVVVATNALVDGTDGLAGRFMDEDYSPLESSGSSSAGAATLDTYSMTHQLMQGVSSASVLSHLDVMTTGGDIDVVASWDSGEEFVAIKRLDPSPATGRVVAINAPLEDGEWSGDVDGVVSNAVRWLADNIRNLPWLEPVCSNMVPVPLPDAALSQAAVSYTCPPVASGKDWNLMLNFDGSKFAKSDAGAVLRGKVTIEHNTSDQGRVNIPVTGNVVEAQTIASLGIDGPSSGMVDTSYDFTATVGPSDVTTPVTYTWEVDDQTPVVATGGASNTQSYSWPTAGTKTMTMTADNGLSTPVVETFEIDIIAEQVALSGVALDGPLSGGVDTMYTFAATVSPSNATTPVTYTWEVDDQTPVVATGGVSNTRSYSWPTAGTKNLSVTADNGVDEPVVSTLQVTIGQLTAVTGVTIEGPSAGLAGRTYVFTATVSPSTATTPVTYTWEVDEQSMVTEPDGVSNTQSYTWPTTGTKTMMVTASNNGGSVVDTLQLTLSERSEEVDKVYLPLIKR